MMFVHNYFIAKPESGLLKVSLVDRGNSKGSGDCFGLGAVKRRPGGQICPFCACIAQELWVFF